MTFGTLFGPFSSLFESPPRLFHEMKSIRDYEEFTSVEPTSDNAEEDPKEALGTDEEPIGVGATEEESIDFKSEPICDASEMETDLPSDSKHYVADDLLLAVETRIKEEVDDDEEQNHAKVQMHSDPDVGEEEEKGEDTRASSNIEEDVKWQDKWHDGIEYHCAQCQVRVFNLIPLMLRDTLIQYCPHLT